jgi:alpha-N-arabinofuranosidase
VGEDFYSVHSSFGYFPGVPIFHSRDLMHWKQIGHVLTRESQLSLVGAAVSGEGIFAPTIRHHEGTFYVITTNVRHGGNFMVTSTDPAGPWSDPIWIQCPLEGGIDPSLLFDDDGTVYFTGTGDNRVQQFKVDVATGMALDDAKAVWPGTGGQYPEAPHLFKIGETYYLTMAEGGTEYMHMQTIARSTTPFGPWEACPHNPILTHRSRNSRLHAVGHSDFVQSFDGRWWLVFHAIRPVDYPPFHVCGRETCVAPVEWIDGWPVVNGGELTTEEMPDTGLPSVGTFPEATRDDFDSEGLAFYWNHLRNPVIDNYQLTERPGWLGIVPSMDGLSSFGRPTFVGRRQRSHSCVAKARFDFHDLRDGDEAGLTVFQTESHHYEIAATRSENALNLIVRRQIGSLSVIVSNVPAPAEEITLVLKATPLEYIFGYSLSENEFVELSRGESRYLGTETAGKFTGCYFGLYAVGSETRSQPGAWIDWMSLD